MSFVKKLFPRAHIEISRGDFSSNFKYCTKDGSWEEKGIRPVTDNHLRGISHAVAEMRIILMTIVGLYNNLHGIDVDQSLFSSEDHDLFHDLADQIREMTYLLDHSQRLCNLARKT